MQAAQKTGINVPVVVRMEGTNVEEGRKILKDSGLNLITLAGNQWQRQGIRTVADNFSWVGSGTPTTYEFTVKELPDAAYVHVFVARGAVAFDGEAISVGDAVRLTDAGPAALVATGDAEIVVWESEDEVHR